MADGVADEEKLLEDAIAALDCLLEEVGGTYGVVDQHASACQACKGMYSSDLPCKSCDIHHSRHQHLQHDRQLKQLLYPRQQAWGQPWSQQPGQQPLIPAQQLVQEQHAQGQPPQAVQQPMQQLQPQLQQWQLQQTMLQTPPQLQDRGEVCAVARIDLGIGTGAGGLRSQPADVLMYANGLFHASQARMVSDGVLRVDLDPKPQAPLSPLSPPPQQCPSQGHWQEKTLLPPPPPCSTHLPLEIQPAYDHEHARATGALRQPPQQPNPLPSETVSAQVEGSNWQRNQGEALQQPQPQPRPHPLAGLHHQLLTTQYQSRSESELCVDSRGRTACRLDIGHHPQPCSAPAEAKVEAAAPASVSVDESSTGGGDANGVRDSREAREKQQHNHQGDGGDTGGTLGCPGPAQGASTTGDRAAAAAAGDTAASAQPFRRLSLNCTRSGNSSSQEQGLQRNQEIHCHSGDLLRRTLEQAGVAAATAAAGQGPDTPAGGALLRSTGGGSAVVAANGRQLLPPPPSAISTAGRGGSQRRSVMYGVTPEQDERLAKAMEKALRLSVDALENPSAGADGGGSGVRTSCAGSERHTLHRLASQSRRSLGRPSAATAADAAAAVVAANTELLNDMVDEVLANKPESNRSVRNAAAGTPHSVLRKMETRVGGTGVGVEKLLLSSGGALGGGQGLTLWAGNKSKVEHARLAVRLLQATDLSRSREDKQIDPYAVVSCEDKSYTSKAVMKSKDPFWDEFFVFDVRNAAFAELKIKVFDHLRCWRPALLGRVCLAVKSIADSPNRYNQPSWHQLRLKTKMKGKVLMQIFYTAEWVHRPLKVLAGTWNVGNAEPPADLGPWLQGVQVLQHDLVAIGVQECFYKVGAGPLEPDAQMVDDEDAYLVEEMGFDDEVMSAFGTTQYGLHDNNDDSSRPNGYGVTNGARGQINAVLDGEDDSLAQGNNLTGCAAPAGPRAARTDTAMRPGFSLVIPNGGAGSASASPSTAGNGEGNTTPDGGGVSGTADGGGASSSADTRESSMTTVGGGGCTTGAVLSPAAGFTRQRGARARSKSVLMPSGAVPPPSLAMMMQATAANKDGMSSHSGSNGASPPPPPLDPRRPGAAARRRHSTLEPPSKPNRVATTAARVGSGLSVTGGGLLPFDGSFTVGAGVAGSGTSGIGLRRPSLGTNGASGPGTRSSAQQQAKTFQQTYKSKGVLGDMAKVGSEFRELWEERLKEAVGPGYFLVAASHMGQIRLLLFARNDVYAAISDVRTGKQATGVAGVATNKGGVGISLRVWNTTIAFVNSHLAAHQDRTRARNNNYRDIIRGLKLDPQGFHMDVLTAFHHVVWMGDLNYRLDYGQQAITPTESPTPADFASLVGEVQKGAFRKLLEVDQLKREIQGKRAFLGFNEGDINFEPTFKVRRRRGFDYNPQRSPAYCDRILFRSNLPLKQIRVLSYFTPSEIATSDHKPVGAVLLVPTVWRVTVEESDSGRGSQGHSGNLIGSEGGAGSHGLGPLHLPRSFHHTASQLQLQGPVVRLTFLMLHAHGLFMLRSRRRSSINPATEFPCPQVLFSAPCMREATVRSRVASMTRDPTWANADDESLGSLVIDLKTFSMAEMAHFRLWIRVLDQREKGARLGGSSAAGGGAMASGSGTKSALTGFGAGGGGGGGGGGAGGNVLARGVLPLLDVVTMLLQDPQGVSPFKVQLELHGLPAGTLEGSMRLEVVERFKSLEGRHLPQRPQYKPARPPPSRGSSFGTSSSPQLAIHGNSFTGTRGGQGGSGAATSNQGSRHRFSGEGTTPIEEEQEATRRSSAGFGTADDDGPGAGGAVGGSSGAGAGGRASFFSTLRRSLGAGGFPRSRVSY